MADNDRPTADAWGGGGISLGLDSLHEGTLEPEGDSEEVVGLGDDAGNHRKLLLALAKVGGEILHGLCAVLFIQAHLTKN